MTDLPSLRETLDAHGLLAKKSFGQHFLLDLNVTRKIVRLAGPFDGRALIEVGPGPGGLTRALLESDAGKVVLVEKDPRFLPLLADRAWAVRQEAATALATLPGLDDAMLHALAEDVLDRYGREALQRAIAERRP